MPAPAEQEVTQTPKPRSPTPKEIVDESERLTDLDYHIEIEYWRSVLQGVHAWALGRMLYGIDTEDQMRAWLEQAAKTQDDLSRWWPGYDAVREITDISRTAGPCGAKAQYIKFLREYRLRKPDTCPDYAWDAISNVYPEVHCDRVLEKGMDGPRVVADRLAFEQWRRERAHGNYKPRRGWVLEKDFRWIPKGVVSPISSNNGQLLTAPEAYDPEEASPIKWTKHEKASGLAKKIEASNSLETNVTIPKALAEELEARSEQQERKEKHEQEHKDDEEDE
jgi:hypothetical protein